MVQTWEETRCSDCVSLVHSCSWSLSQLCHWFPVHLKWAQSLTQSELLSEVSTDMTQTCYQELFLPRYWLLHIYDVITSPINSALTGFLSFHTLNNNQWTQHWFNVKKFPVYSVKQKHCFFFFLFWSKSNIHSSSTLKRPTWAWGDLCWEINVLMFLQSDSSCECDVTECSRTSVLWVSLQIYTVTRAASVCSAL